jgi:heterogeneous nuclear ribonucleoprotein F/H
MRGLPFKATEEDVMTFFSPIEPISVTIKSDALGRPSGDAFAEFANQEDANAGMSKDKALMEHRYIELFLMDSHPKPKIGYATGSSSGFMTYKHHPRPPYHARV